MTFFLHTVQGLQNSSFPWSMTMVSQSTSAESAVQSVWDGAVLAMWNEASLNPFIPADTTLTQTSSSTATATFTQFTKTVSDHSIPGTASVPALPYRTCETITFRSAFATRWGRGRWFFPALAQSALDTNGYDILPDAVNALVAGMDAFFSGLGSTIQPQILHRRAPQSGAVTAFSTSVINGADIANRFTTQKRRADKLVPTRSDITT